MLIMIAAQAASSIIGGIMAKKKSERTSADMRALYSEMQRLYGDINLPSIDQLVVNYDSQYNPEKETAIKMGPSAYEGVNLDPRLMEDVNYALDSLKQRSQTGMSPEFEAELRQARYEADARAKAQDRSLAEEAAARGQSGAYEMARRIQGSAGQGTQAQMAADRLAMMSQDERDQALNALSSLAMNQQNVVTGLQEKKASARDLINQYNTQNQQSVQQRNIGNLNEANLYKDKLGYQNAQNQAQAYQQAYQNQLGLANAQAGILSGQATNMGQMGQNQANNTYNMWSGVGQAFGSGIGYASQQEKEPKPGQSYMSDLNQNRYKFSPTGYSMWDENPYGGN